MRAASRNIARECSRYARTDLHMRRDPVGGNGLPTTEGPRDADDLLTIEELAERLKVKTTTIREWGRSGRIPARRLSHKVVRYCLPDVLAALEASRGRGAGR